MIASESRPAPHSEECCASACPESETGPDRLETVTLSFRHTAWGFNLCFPPINMGQAVIPAPVWSPWGTPWISAPNCVNCELTWGSEVIHSTPSFLLDLERSGYETGDEPVQGGGGPQFLSSPLNEGSKFKELISVVQTIDLVP